MSLAYPWILLFPIVAYLPQLVKSARKFDRIQFPDRQRLAPSRTQGWRAALRKPVLHFLSLLAICLLAFTAARPQKVTPVPLPDTARNLMLALDVSGSMQTRDFEVGGRVASRMDAVKYVVSQFVSRRQGDRIGLVIFGTESFLECPLTLDHDLVIRMIGNLEVGIAGEGTAIGDGLALGLKRIASSTQGREAIFNNSENLSESSALILLTDGVNTSGSIDPLQAADIAMNLGIKIHTVGIGSNNTAAMARQNPFYGSNVTRYDFDEAMLKAIAQKSGGYYFNASDLAGLEKVYEEIDALEKKDVESIERMQVEELYLPYLLAAIVSYLLYIALARSVFMVVP